MCKGPVCTLDSKLVLLQLDNDELTHAVVY